MSPAHNLALRKRLTGATGILEQTRTVTQSVEQSEQYSPHPCKRACLPSHVYADAALLLRRLQRHAKLLLAPIPNSPCMEYCMHRLTCQRVHSQVMFLQSLHAHCPNATKQVRKRYK
jgi:hypothetical protein